MKQILFKALLIFALLSLGSDLFAAEIVDTAKLEIIYMHIAYDRRKDEKKVTDEMLLVGDRYQFYSGYGDYQLDSLLKDPGFRKLDRNQKSLKTKNLGCIFKRILFDTRQNNLEVTKSIMMDRFLYSEPIPTFDWDISDETEEILGYNCSVATTTWRGRKWKAWFSDIPVDGGPWQLRGLPGLILKLESEDGDHSFIAEEIRNDIHPIQRWKGINITREKFLKEEKNYCLNFGKIMGASPLINATPEQLKKNNNKTLFYAPIELE